MENNNCVFCKTPLISDEEPIKVGFGFDEFEYDSMRKEAIIPRTVGLKCPKCKLKYARK